MAISTQLPFVIFFLLISTSPSILSVANLSVISHPSKLQLPLGDAIEGSPGCRPGSIVVCNRIRIRGLSRAQDLDKYAHALKIRVSAAQGDAIFRVQTVEVCLHRNESVGIGMCPEAQWQKLSKGGSWVQSVSPFGDRILDVRMLPDPSRTVEVSTEHELLFHRVVFLVMGVVMMVAARALSESVVFYYGSFMTVGIIIVILLVLFQGMKLLPTGRKSSLAIVMYSSIVGVATFILHYLSGLLRSILVEIGITEDMHNPLGVFLLVCLVLAGAWFGYWGVRKLVLTDDGSVGSDVAYFVEWAILIFAAVMILQSSLDTLLAAQALIFAIMTTAIARIHGKLRFLRRLVKKTLKRIRITRDEISPSRYSSDYSYPFQNSGSKLYSARARNLRPTPCTSPVQGDEISPSQYSSDYSHPFQNSGSELYRARAGNLRPSLCTSPVQGLMRTPQISSETNTYYSSFHKTPEREKFSKEDWDKFTEENTKAALRELVSSPDFNKWAVANAERLTLTSPDVATRQRKRRIFRWF